MKVLKRTKTYCIVHKPAGMVVYADTPADQKFSVQLELQQQLAQKVYPVHRIDKSTCGVLVFALTQAKASQLATLFKEKKVEKSYIAFVHGEAPESTRIDLPLKRHKQKLTEIAVTNLTTLSRVEILARGEKRHYSLVRATPETGRYHQIRRHLKMIKCPIVGDVTYGNSWNNDYFKSEFGIERALLCANSLSFVDLETRERVTVTTEPDKDFANLLNKLKLKASI